jgi:hypothetical protein
MHTLLSTWFPSVTPVLADALWIGGGTLGLILLIVVIVVLMRR